MLKEKQAEEHGIDEEPMSPIKAGVIVGTILLGVAALIFLVIWLLSRGDESIVGAEPLSEEEELEVTEIVESFASEVTNFGISDLNVSYSDSEGIEFENDEISRREAYLPVRESYLHELSDIHFSDSVLNRWNNEEEHLQSFYSQDIAVTNISQASVITVGNADYRYVNADVEWVSIERLWVNSASDVSWDGSYNILERSFVEDDVTVQLLETANGWEIYRVNGISHIRATVLWRDPTLSVTIPGELEIVGQTDALWDPDDFLSTAEQTNDINNDTLNSDSEEDND